MEVRIKTLAKEYSNAARDRPTKKHQRWEFRQKKTFLLYKRRDYHFLCASPPCRAREDHFNWFRFHNSLSTQFDSSSYLFLHQHTGASIPRKSKFRDQIEPKNLKFGWNSCKSEVGGGGGGWSVKANENGGEISRVVDQESSSNGKDNSSRHDVVYVILNFHELPSHLCSRCLHRSPIHQILHRLVIRSSISPHMDQFELVLFPEISKLATILLLDIYIENSLNLPLLYQFFFLINIHLVHKMRNSLVPKLHTPARQ